MQETTLEFASVHARARRRHARSRLLGWWRPEVPPGSAGADIRPRQPRHSMKAQDACPGDPRGCVRRTGPGFRVGGGRWTRRPSSDGAPEALAAARRGRRSALVQSSSSSGSRSGGEGGRRCPTGRLPTATVTRRNLVLRDEIDGTLGYARRPHRSRRSAPGTVMRLPAEGSVVTRGRSLYYVNAAGAVSSTGDAAVAAPRRRASPTAPTSSSSSGTSSSSDTTRAG